MLTWKEMTCVDNRQIAHCVNCCNINIPGCCRKRSVFCDCYRNMGHLLCGVERIKRFVNVHLHCIVSNIPSKVCKCSGPPELLSSEVSFSRTCNIPKQWKLHRKQGAIWMKYVFCSYFEFTNFVIHWKLHLLSPKIIMLTKTNICSV